VFFQTIARNALAQETEDNFPEMPDLIRPNQGDNRANKDACAC
jgi:hypothetical protein